MSHGIHRVQLSGKGRKFQGSKIYDRNQDPILIPAVLNHCISFKFMNFYTREYELCFFFFKFSDVVNLQDCAPGYYRSSKSPYRGVCIPCSCNGHADSCDTETGECLVSTLCNVVTVFDYSKIESGY